MRFPRYLRSHLASVIKYQRRAIADAIVITLALFVFFLFIQSFDIHALFEMMDASVDTFNDSLFDQLILVGLLSVIGFFVFSIRRLQDQRREILARRVAENRAQQALVRAEEASHTKSLFLANMSHEIRTPLNGVLGMAELLEPTLSEPRQKLMISTIRTSGEILLSILNNVLDMSKIEAGKFDLEQVPFKPAELARQVEAVYALMADEKGLEFEVLTSRGCDAERLGDPHRIMQILHNLMSNALKFTDKGGVTLKLACRAGQPLTIEVTDTGIGMTPEQSDRIFDSFEQADGSVTRRFGGTGLGMAIVRQLVQLMGGEISVASVPDRGTVVLVSLPLACADPPVAVEVAPPVVHTEVRFDGLRVLIADDSASNRLVLREILSNTGAVIVMVEDGQQALDAWRSAAFDLLLLDISMPVMDGLTALKIIRAEEAAQGRAAVPAIAVTASAMSHQVADNIIGGFNWHLSKPFRRQDLLDAIVALTQ